MKRWFPSVGDAKIPVKINDQKSFNTRCSRWTSVMLVIAVLAFSIYDIARWISEKDVILEEKSLPISEFFPKDRVDKYHVEMVRQLNFSIPRFGPDSTTLTNCRARFRSRPSRTQRLLNQRNSLNLGATPEQYLPCEWDVYEMKCEKCVPLIVPEKLEVVGLQSSGCAYAVDIRRFGNMVETYNNGTIGERKCTNDRSLNQKSNSWALWFEAVWQPRFKNDEMPPIRQQSGDPSCALQPVQSAIWQPDDSKVMDDCDGCRWFAKYRSSRIVRDKDQGIITDDQVLISTTLWREISDNIFEITPLVVEKMDPWLNIRNVSRKIAFEVSRTISMKESRKTEPQKKEEGFKYRLRAEYSRTYKKLIISFTVGNPELFWS